jgi:hypothetical protein
VTFIALGIVEILLAAAIGASSHLGKANARRSCEDILGHADKTSTVRERYGTISEEEFHNE